jgi:tRNA A37 threonylcarbamoyladenosine synthetase subunit TsaC/SUA5/YrdC
LVKELGQPIISTSVKSEDGETMNNPDLIRERFGHCVDLIIDGGLCPGGQSTVISLEDDTVEIIRIGRVDVSAFT